MQLTKYLAIKKMTYSMFAKECGLCVSTIIKVVKGRTITPVTKAKIEQFGIKLLNPVSEVGRKEGSVGKRWNNKPRRNPRTYSAWYRMMRSCYDEKFSSYSRYGAHGVKVCDNWKEFAVFLVEMGDIPDNMKGIALKDGKVVFNKDNCKYVPDVRKDRYCARCASLIKE